MAEVLGGRGVVVRVATWNLENLFRPGGDAGPPSETEYKAKLAALADTIGQLAPDVLGVQEVGSPEALADLVAKLGGDWHTELADPDRRGIRVGLLSRLPLSEVQQTAGYIDGLQPVQVDDDGTSIATMSRPALRARVDVAGTPIDVVCCHLKSKLLSFPGGRFSTSDEDERARYAVYALGRRAAEAATVRGIATQLLNGQGQGQALVVLGDLNDTEHSATTTMLNGPGGSEIGTPGFGRPDMGDTTRLWNLAPMIPAQRQFSRTYRGRPEMIDHILVSHALLDGLGGVDTIDVGAGSVNDTPGDRAGDPASDHRPVVADLTP
jgi:endonuclease/exonuclease/phosphatase family metal-dependent hydrolase